MSAIELFACKPHNLRLSPKACGANWKMVNRGAPTTMPGTAMTGSGTRAQRVYGRAHCINCAIGEAHARGDVVPVERLVWKAPPRALEPPPPPVTVVPRVEGVLDDKRAKPTAPTPWDREVAEVRAAKTRNAARAAADDEAPRAQTTTPEEESMQTNRSRTSNDGSAALADDVLEREKRAQRGQRTAEDRAAAVADILTREKAIADYADAYGVSDQTIRNWLKTVGITSTLDWPTRTELQERARRAAEADLSPEVQSDTGDDDCAQHPEHEACSNCTVDEPASVRAELERNLPDDEEPSIGDLIPEFHPRVMPQTELAELDEGRAWTDADLARLTREDLVEALRQAEAAGREGATPPEVVPTRASAPVLEAPPPDGDRRSRRRPPLPGRGRAHRAHPIRRRSIRPLAPRSEIPRRCPVCE